MPFFTTAKLIPTVNTYASKRYNFSLFFNQKITLSLPQSYSRRCHIIKIDILKIRLTTELSTLQLTYFAPSKIVIPLTSCLKYPLANPWFLLTRKYLEEKHLQSIMNETILKYMQTPKRLCLPCLLTGEAINWQRHRFRL